MGRYICTRQKRLLLNDSHSFQINMHVINTSIKFPRLIVEVYPGSKIYTKHPGAVDEILKKLLHRSELILNKMEVLSSKRFYPASE